jgi:hypothetical protein
MTAYRPEFEAALRLFARVSEAMKVRGFQAPVLVGGAGITVTGASSPKQPVMLNLFQHLIISSRRCLSKILKQVQDDPLGQHLLCAFAPLRDKKMYGPKGDSRA